MKGISKIIFFVLILITGSSILANKSSPPFDTKSVCENTSKFQNYKNGTYLDNNTLTTTAEEQDIEEDDDNVEHTSFFPNLFGRHYSKNNFLKVNCSSKGYFQKIPFYLLYLQFKVFI